MIKLAPWQWLLVVMFAAQGWAHALPTPHGGDEDMEGMNMTISLMSVEWSESFDVPNYFGFAEHRFWIWSHIATMMLSWCVVLPVAVMFSIAKSRYSIYTNLAFLASNGLGFFFGMVYNMSTPDLYENNAHHKIGWIFSITALVWVLLGMIRQLGPSKPIRPKYQPLLSDEHAGRWSDDSGCATLRNLSIGSVSPATENEMRAFPESLQKEDEDEELEMEKPASRGLERLVGTKVSSHLTKAMGVISFVYVFIERALPLMAFVLISTGFVTFGGIFRQSQVFSGLAHFIKGGIFFWVGILAVGRWAGGFADLGWAWNVKPPALVIGRRKAAVPSAEFVESCLIFVYGASNIWLEHLNATEWSAMDFEHVSITILFFGGGLLGMMIESKRARRFLNATINSHVPASTMAFPSPATATPEHPTWSPPLGSSQSESQTATPMNPVPALTILLLGVIMSAHTQHSELAAKIHSYWGSLFAFAAAARMGSYLLHYIKPPVSYLPGRPPTEIISGFCLMAGGFLFMISPRDITDVMEGYGGDAMVAFTVTMGVAAVASAGVVASMAVKGWAVSMEQKRLGQRTGDMAAQQSAETNV